MVDRPTMKWDEGWKEERPGEEGGREGVVLVRFSYRMTSMSDRVRDRRGGLRAGEGDMVKPPIFSAIRRREGGREGGRGDRQTYHLPTPCL